MRTADFFVATTRRAAMVAAFGLARRTATGKLMDRLPGETAELLRTDHARPPEVVVRAVLASDDRRMLAALAGNGQLGRGEALALARLGDPDVGRALHRKGSRQVREAVWAAADPADPRWRDGLVADLLRSQLRQPLATALAAPFPELVRHALAHLGGQLPAWVVADAARVILAQGSPSLVRELADEVEAGEWALSHPEIPGLLRAAADAAEPDSVLARGRERMRSTAGGPRAADADLGATAASGRATDACGTADARAAAAVMDAWLIGLRCGERLRTEADEDEGHSGERAIPADWHVDWDLVQREHARYPFDQYSLEECTRWPGCPDELALAAFDARGRRRAERLGVLPAAVLEPPYAPTDDHDLSELVHTGLTQGWFDAADVLARVRPARAVLDAFQRIAGAERHPHFRPLAEPFAAALRNLVAPLGADPDAWTALHVLQPRFTGPCVELVGAAVELAERNRAAGTPTAWPRATPAKFPAEEPSGARGQFYVLLTAAPDDVQCAVIPNLDPRGIQQLTVFAPLSARVHEHVLAVGGVDTAIANASRWDMPQEVVERLLAMDHPEVNARLYDFGAIDMHQRVRICAGRPYDGSDRVIPTSPRLAEVLAATGPAKRRHWLLAALDCGDPVLLRAMLGRTKLHTDVGRLRVVIGLWERHGPDAVRELLDETEFPGRRSSGARHPFPAATHRVVREALDGGRGLDALRARLAAAREPAEQPAYLLGKSRDHAERVRHLLAESDAPLAWQSLLERHEKEPLPPSALAALADEPACPRTFLLDVLRTLPVPARMAGLIWLPRALEDGRLTADDVLRHAHPAGVAVEYLTGVAAHSGAYPPDFSPPCTDASTLITETGADDPEVWAVAVHLLPGFTGTIPELLTTAAAMAR